MIAQAIPSSMSPAISPATQNPADGHGVPQSLIDRTYDAAARFHAQPMTKKLPLKVDEHNIGYLPISDAASPQAAAQGRKPSHNASAKA
jgi:hypothetical protein